MVSRFTLWFADNFCGIPFTFAGRRMSSRGPIILHGFTDNHTFFRAFAHGCRHGLRNHAHIYARIYPGITVWLTHSRFVSPDCRITSSIHGCNPRLPVLLPGFPDQRTFSRIVLCKNTIRDLNSEVKNARFV